MIDHPYGRARDRGRGPGRDGAWSPLRLAPALWIRADRGVTLNAGNIASWADQSGNGRHFSQATAGAQLPYNASGGPNGTPFATIGNARWMQSVTSAADWKWLHTPSSHVFVVSRATSLASLTTLIATCDPGTPRVGNVIRRTDSRQQFTNVRAAGAPYPVNAVSTVGDVVLNAWRVDEHIWDHPGGVKLFSTLNGGASIFVGSLATAVDTANPSQPAMIGREIPGTPVGNENDVSEYLAWAAPLSAPNRAAVLRYLGARYGIAVAL